MTTLAAVFASRKILRQRLRAIYRTESLVLFGVPAALLFASLWGLWPGMINHLVINGVGLILFPG
jgi:hypothetical protein